MTKPGLIKNTLEYPNKTTFATDTVLNFASVTEHDIPNPGLLKITLPEDCEIVDAPKVTGLEMKEF